MNFGALIQLYMPINYINVVKMVNIIHAKHQHVGCPC